MNHEWIAKTMYKLLMNIQEGMEIVWLDINIPSKENTYLRLVYYDKIHRKERSWHEYP